MRPLAVCVPFLGQFSKITERNLQALFRAGLSRDMYLKIRQGSHISMMRNSFITTSRMIKQNDTGLDYLLIDSDMRFKVADIVKLLDTKSLVVGAAYQQQGNPDKVMAGDWDSLGGTSALWSWGMKGTGEIEADFVAPGCMYVSGTVFPKMEFPYFRHKILKYGDQQVETQEDIGFCRELAKAGIKPRVNVSVRVGHLQRKRDKAEQIHRRILHGRE